MPPFLSITMFSSQLAQWKVDNFKHLNNRFTERINYLDTYRYASKVEELFAVFQSRFGELAAEANNIYIFVSPFSFPESNLSAFNEDLQLEVIDLKCNSASRYRFIELPVLQYYPLWKILYRSGACSCPSILNICIILRNVS